MDEYIEKMKQFKFRTHEAVRVYECFKNYISLKYLDELIDSLERDGYVANV